MNEKFVSGSDNGNRISNKWQDKCHQFLQIVQKLRVRVFGDSQQLYPVGYGDDRVDAQYQKIILFTVKHKSSNYSMPLHFKMRL